MLWCHIIDIKQVRYIKTEYSTFSEILINLIYKQSYLSMINILDTLNKGNDTISTSFNFFVALMLYKEESFYSSTDIKYNCTMYHYIEGEFSMLFIIFFFMTHPLTCAKGNTIIIELQFLYVAWITRCKNLKNWVNNKILQQTYLPILCWQQYENDLTSMLYT